MFKIDCVTDVLNIVIALSALALAVSYSISQWRTGSSKASAEAIITYRAELDIIKQTVERLQTESKVKDQQIFNLQGQINVLKEVPLVNIDTTLKEIAKFNKCLMDINTQILSRLNSDAKIKKEDDDKAGARTKN